MRRIMQCYLIHTMRSALPVATVMMMLLVMLDAMETTTASTTLVGGVVEVVVKVTAAVAKVVVGIVILVAVLAVVLEKRETHERDKKGREADVGQPEQGDGNTRQSAFFAGCGCRGIERSRVVGHRRSNQVCHVHIAILLKAHIQPGCSP